MPFRRLVHWIDGLGFDGRLRAIKVGGVVALAGCFVVADGLVLTYGFGLSLVGSAVGWVGTGISVVAASWNTLVALRGRKQSKQFRAECEEREQRIMRGFGYTR